MLIRRYGLTMFLFFFLVSTLCPSSAYADNNALIVRGVMRTLAAAFEVPKGMLANSTRAFPLGMVAGAISGTFRTVAGVLGGALDIAKGSAPYAKYAALAL